MIALQVLAFTLIALLFALLIRDGRRRNRVHAADLAAARQASWDEHVNQAVRNTEEPIYERLAHEVAAGVDAEWYAATTTGWATR